MVPPRSILRWCGAIGVVVFVLDCGRARPIVDTSNSDSGGFPDAGATGDAGTGDAGVLVETNVLVSADFASAGTAAFAALQTLVTDDNATKLIAVGDESYVGGSTAVFAQNNPWDAFKAMTFPVAGNHEFGTSGGTEGQYFYGEYSGPGNNAANQIFPLQSGSIDYDFSYYSDAVPGWRLIFLNSNVNFANQSAAGQASNVMSWIDGFRQANGGHGCVLVAIHQAIWSQHYSGSSDNGDSWRTSVLPIWTAATTAASGPADLFLQAHVHVYEEFPILDPSGVAADAGTKLFTVGVGGRGQLACTTDCSDWTGTLLDYRAAPVTGALKLGLYGAASTRGAYAYSFETSGTQTAPPNPIPCNQ